jgi:hypothetical protein
MDLRPESFRGGAEALSRSASVKTPAPSEVAEVAAAFPSDFNSGGVVGDRRAGEHLKVPPR